MWDKTLQIHKVLGSPDCMLSCLQSWAEAGWIRWLDFGLARFLYQEINNGETELSPLLLLGVALCSYQNGHGHLCLDLEHCLSAPDQALLLPSEHSLNADVVTPAALLAQLNLQDWISALQDPRVCTTVIGTETEAAVDTPMVLVKYAHNARLYLTRLWSYENRLQQAIQQRTDTLVALDKSRLQQALSEVFPQYNVPTPETASADELALLQCDWQKIACALAARRQMAVITGGPGTGKTTTVIRLLYVLKKLQGDSEPLRIKLAAPTGKAAARLSTSIQQQLDRLPDRSGIPHEVSTVHRLLGPVRNSRFFRHDAANPLPADVVVVDEASMVDVELMAQLMDALAPDARLILLGDKDQLASVEAGAILGSLCARANTGAYTTDTVQWIGDVCAQQIPSSLHDATQTVAGRALDQAICMLRYSHRFGRIPGIGALAKAVNNNDQELLQLFDGRYKELQSLMLANTRDTRLELLVCDQHSGYGAYLHKIRQLPPASADNNDYDRWAADILDTHAGFQLLAAVRKGEFGVEELNQRIRHILTRDGLLDSSADTEAEWYAGRPVMVVKNDYNLGLMNGDIGITLAYPDLRRPGHYRLLVAFEDRTRSSGIRWVLPSRLQQVETVFAMTVHKSQGSEFRHTALVLPPVSSPILTRELVYTGVTRASEKFTLVYSNREVLLDAISARVFRAGGLEDALA
jgi:exodeoxyribonuclease V alpha subunit